MLTSKLKQVALTFCLIGLTGFLFPAAVYADEVNSWGGGSGWFDASKAAAQKAAEEKRKAKKQKRLEEQKAAEEKKAAEAAGAVNTDTK